MRTHTATPMKAIGASVYLANNSGGFDVRHCPNSEELAALIADSCNAHDELVSLLKAVDNKLEAMHMYHSGPAASAIRGLREKIVSGLAKAGAA